MLHEKHTAEEFNLDDTYASADLSAGMPKFCRYWDVELREAPLEPGRYVMGPAEAVARCDENTIGVVATLGTTFTGHYESVEEISDALNQLQQDRRLDIT